MKITVYCGSVFGNDEKYRKAAKEIADFIAYKGHSLVYGGSKTGLMGLVANEVLNDGGKVVGVTPVFFAGVERAHSELTSLEVVEDMSARKKRMVELGDAFIALPGGPGTLEEISEVISWLRIDRIDCPIVVYDLDGYYRPLYDMYRQMVDAGFMGQRDLERILFSSDINEIESFINNYKLGQGTFSKKKIEY